MQKGPGVIGTPGPFLCRCNCYCVYDYTRQKLHGANTWFTAMLRLGATLHTPYTMVAWMSCSDFTLGDVSFLTAWMPSALAFAAASVVM